MAALVLKNTLKNHVATLMSADENSINELELVKDTLVKKLLEKENKMIYPFETKILKEVSKILAKLTV